MRKDYKYIIGIDTGVSTGFALWNKNKVKFDFIETVSIDAAIIRVLNLSKKYKDELFVRVEDARKRFWFGTAGREKLQGAGSIKRDAKIWEDFLKNARIDFEMVPPRLNKTKLNADAFNKITGYVGQTSQHARDAGMLVFKWQ